MTCINLIPYEEEIQGNLSKWQNPLACVSSASPLKVTFNNTRGRNIILWIPSVLQPLSLSYQWLTTHVLTGPQGKWSSSPNFVIKIVLPINPFPACKPLFYILFLLISQTFQRFQFAITTWRRFSVNQRLLLYHHIALMTVQSTCCSSPSKSWLYSLSLPETTAMKEYIQAALAAGILQPSSSPAGTGFFFISMKDKSLRPCIDYRGLNDITIKSRYPLLLMSSAFQRLQEAKVFTALDSNKRFRCFPGPRQLCS